MSKRWKTRQLNAAKIERSHEVTAQFYGDVIAELERLKAMPADERERIRQAVNGGQRIGFCSAHQSPRSGCPICFPPIKP